MSTVDPARDVHNRADGMRERARALDHMRVRMRLGDRAEQRGRSFWFRKTYPTDPDLRLTPQESQLFYEWATMKQHEYEAEANRFDATVRIVDA